jgi:hypothetical protein
MKKKGFYFLLATLFLVSYVFLYLTLWLENWKSEVSLLIASDEATYPWEMNVWLSNESIQKFYSIAGQYALYKINNFSIYHPLKYDYKNELRYLNISFFSLLSGQKALVSVDGTPLSYSSTERKIYSLPGFVESFNETINKRGFYVASFSLTPINFSFVDPVNFNATCLFSLSIHSIDERFQTTRTYYLSHIFNVSGFVDPFVARESAKLGFVGEEGREMAEKQIFFVNVSPPQLVPKEIEYCKGDSDCNSKHMQGLGFFYGPIVSVKNAKKVPKYERNRYILYGDFDDIIALNKNPSYLEFGAIILNNSPVSITYGSCPSSESKTFNAKTYQGDSCRLIVEHPLSKPYVVVPDLSLDELSASPKGKAVLFIAKRNITTNPIDAAKWKTRGVKLYDIEKLRDFVLCAYYVPSDKGLSYPQRLSAKALSLIGTSKYGIISTVVGRWAGGEYLPSYNKYSRIDVDFFTHQDGTKIRGLPGCKMYNDCSTPAGVHAPLGQFSLSKVFQKIFGVEDMACDDGWAECG